MTEAMDGSSELADGVQNMSRQDQFADDYDDEAVLEGASEKVTLGGRDYVLAEPTRGVARRWRRQFADILDRAQTAAQSGDSFALQADIQDELMDSIFAFDEKIAADKDWIEEHAKEREILKAFAACVHLVKDPLASMQALLGGAQSVTANRATRRATKNGTAKANT